MPRSELIRMRDIDVSDVQRGLIWRVIDTSETDWLDWVVTETNRVSSQDIIVHSGVIVEDGRAVHPVLQTKYYADAGEVGEGTVFLYGAWRKAGPELGLKGRIIGPFLGRISTLDIHEYQKGSFDNRPDHYAKFRHYAAQIGRTGDISPFPDYPPTIPAKYLSMSTASKMDYVRSAISEAESLQRNGKVSKGNKLVGRVGQVFELLKSDPENHQLLRRMLADEDRLVVGWAKYVLFDLFPDDCLKVIRRVAKEDSLEGLGAQFWLREHGYK